MSEGTPKGEKRTGEDLCDEIRRIGSHKREDCPCDRALREAYDKGFADCRQKAIEAINGWTYDKRGHTNLADLIASFLPSEGGSK